MLLLVEEESVACFHITTYINQSSLFDTYTCAVLTMRASTRMPLAFDQLEMLCPCKKVIVFENVGFRSCSKPLCVQRADYDIMHACATIFQFALDRGLGTVLLFEDDFFWSTRMSRSHALEIERFVLQTPSLDHYFLGCIPILTLAIGYHWRVHSAGGAHAVIHTEKGMRRFVEDHKNLCQLCQGTAGCVPDLFWTTRHECYCYYVPLAYQIFPSTESQQTSWPAFAGIAMRSMTNLEKSAHPWYDIFYATQVMLPITVTLLLVFYVVSRSTRSADSAEAPTTQKHTPSSTLTFVTSPNLANRSPASDGMFHL